VYGGNIYGTCVFKPAMNERLEEGLMMGEKTKTVIQAEVNPEENGCLEYALVHALCLKKCTNFETA